MRMSSILELLPTFNFLRIILQVSIGLCFGGLNFASAVTWLAQAMADIQQNRFYAVCKISDYLDLGR
jgi:hypothetical protein